MNTPRYYVDKFELTEHGTEELALVEEIQTDARAEPLEVLRDVLHDFRRVSNLRPPSWVGGGDMFCMDPVLRDRINALLFDAPEPGAAGGITGD